MCTPTGILSNNSTALDHFVNLKKEISNQIRDNDGLDDSSIELKLNNNFMHKSRIENGKLENCDLSSLDSNQDDINNLKEQVDKLKRINKQLYQYELEKVYRS